MKHNYIPVNDKVLAYRGLDLNAKILMCVIGGEYPNRNYLNLKYMASRLGWTVSKVRENLNVLERSGMITSEEQEYGDDGVWSPVLTERGEALFESNGSTYCLYLSAGLAVGSRSFSPRVSSQLKLILADIHGITTKTEEYTDRAKCYKKTNDAINEMLGCSKGSDTAERRLSTLEGLGFIGRHTIQISRAKKKRTITLTQKAIDLIALGESKEVESVNDAELIAINEMRKEKMRLEEIARISKELIVETQFDCLWKIYGGVGNKSRARQHWLRLNQEQRDEIFAKVPNYVASTRDIQFRKHLDHWIDPAHELWKAPAKPAFGSAALKMKNGQWVDENGMKRMILQ